MGLEFIQQYGGRRLEPYQPQPILEEFAPPEASETEEPDERIELGYEVDSEEWEPIDLNLPEQWKPRHWDERPTRFVDGKDVGETVAWLRSPAGHPVPIRLSQIGGISMRVVDGECRREFTVMDRIVSMEMDVFPWEEVESFAIALQSYGFRLLSARPEMGLSYDFERMRKAAQTKSNEEMVSLERAIIAQIDAEPTVVDGRLEPRLRGHSRTDLPIFGVIKTHWRNYLHPQGLQVKYQLDVGQRTPVFCLNDRLPVITWFVRLSGRNGASPNWGLVRIEVPRSWFEARGHFDYAFIDQLSRTVLEYRCREQSYGRAPVSLHPIVRAEESLGALFAPSQSVTSNFYRLTQL